MPFIDLTSLQLATDTFASQTMEKLVNDIGSIRTHLNSTELQLYEANEKVAELLEIVSALWQIM